MTPARLRNWILLFAVALIAAIAAFFLHARWLGRRLSRDVPYELAKTIQQSTQGFTHSESRGGHTIYSLHASKAVQFKSDGHAELHDVSITLYNAQGAPANRIYGHAFDWDPVHGIARALGEVHIDFQGDASPTPKTGGDVTEEGEGKNTVHLKTSGLVFNKQTGLADTTEKIEFRTSAAAGSAVGASFNSQTGVMILMSEVDFNSSVGGSPFSVRAHHAQFDRESRLVYLLDEVTDFQDNHSSSDQATIAFRADGSAYQVEAEGKVVLRGSNGQTINTRRLHVDLDAKSAPLRAKVDGGLLYTASSEGRSLHGTASSGTMLLGPQMTIRHAQLRDAVSLVDTETFAGHASEKGKTKANPPVSSSREMQATQMDVDFVTGPDRSPQAKNIIAVGSARLNVHTIYSHTSPQETTIQGDQLVASLVDGEVLSSLRGTGHTSLVDVSPTGVKQSSSGDSLLLTFAEPQQASAHTERASEEKTATLASHAVAQLRLAVQQGHVTLAQEVTGKTTQPKAPPNVTRAVADRAEYDAVSQVIQLSGNPRVLHAGAELSAGAIAMEHATGNATATGGVKATYHASAAQPNVAFAGSGAVHVVSDRAHLDHATDLAIFYGNPGAAARLWQGSNSIAAPVLELSQAHSTLSAHGVGDELAAVNAVFTSATGSAPGHAAAASPAGADSVVRVQSRTLVYSDTGRKATFGGGVAAQTPTGTLHANAMDVYLVAVSAPHSPGGGPPGQQNSSVERIVARGKVELLQPGRKAAGEELNYTAADSQFVLTGTAASPPRLNDQVRGTVVGTSLIFKDRDDSVIVSGENEKTVTQTRVAK